MSKALFGILWQEWVLFRRKFWLITAGALVTPLLYLVAFGWGLGSQVSLASGGSYLQFILPGLVGMNTMLTSYSNVASHVCISRIFFQTFESYMIAPMKPLTYAIGKVLAGVGYGIYGASLMVIPLAIFGGGLALGWIFFLTALANCFAFSALGLLAGIVAEDHRSLSRFSTFVITPMTFLCGTFFEVGQMPAGISHLIGVLPLSQANAGLRDISPNFGETALHIGVLLAYCALFFGLALHRCQKAE